MKTNQIFYLIILLALTINCNSKKKQINQFSSFSDTLIIKTIRQKGTDIFSAGAGKLYFLDTSEYYKYPVIFPENITNIKVAYKIIDFKKFDYEAFHNNDIRNDTLFMHNSICFLSGQKGNDSIFIVDENNNKDFRDDSVRLFPRMDWYDTLSLIKCKYLINDGVKFINDSSWLNIGTINNELWEFVSHHLEAKFKINDDTFQIRLVDGQFGFSFDEPKLTLVSHDGTKKDTLPVSKQIKKDEYLKLNNTFYRFDTISYDGKYVTLIKEGNNKSKTWTKIDTLEPDIKINEREELKTYELQGTKAPDWKLKEIYGDSISLSDIEQKVILMQFTGIGCAPCHASIPFLKKLADNYKNKNFELVSIETWSNNITDIERYKDINEMNYRFLVSKKEIKDKYKIEGVPTFFILDEKRMIKKVIIGYQKGDTDKEIINLIEAML